MLLPDPTPFSNAFANSSGARGSATNGRAAADTMGGAATRAAGQSRSPLTDSRDRLLTNVHDFWSRGLNNMGVVLNDARAAKWLSLGTLVLAGVGVMTAGYFIFQQVTGMGGYSGGATPRTVTVLGTGTKSFKPAKAEVSFSYSYQDTGRDQTEPAGDLKFNSIIQGLNQYQPVEVSKTTAQVVETGRAALPLGAGATAGAPGSTGVNLAQGIRYQYVNAARVKVGNPELIKDVISYLYAQGASTVTQVRYIPENEDAANAELRELAVKDAKMKATDLVKAAGARLGKVVNMQEGGTPSQAGGTVIDSSANLAGVASATGDIELQSVVTVMFEVR